MELGDSARVPLPEGEGPAVEEPEQEVERQAPEASVHDGQESPVDGEDGPVGVQGDGEEGDLSSVLLKKKKNDSLAKVFLSAALVLMLAVTGWLLYKKALAPPTKLPLPPVTEIDEQVKFYSKKMIEMREVLDGAWSMASNTVKRVFTSNFMPSADREHVAESKALSYYKLHVLEMLEVPPPATHDDIEAKKEYLYKLQMLTSILDGAARRLEALKTLEVNAELPALIFGQESGERKAQDLEGDVDFDTFRQKLTERGVLYAPIGCLLQNKPVATVPAAKVLELLDLLAMEEKMTLLDRSVHEAFNHFLKGQGFSLKTLQPEAAAKVAAIKLPRDPTAMDTRTLVLFLHSRYNSVEDEEDKEQILDSLALNWEEETVLRATEQLRRHHEGKLEGLLRQKKETLFQARQAHPPVPLTHGFSLALFLL